MMPAPVKGREQQEATAMMLGRVSYEAFALVWPKMDDFAEYKAMPKYMVSTTLTETTRDWGDITILRSLDEVANLKEAEGGPIIVHGSATLNRNLADAGLIDRYHLLVFPTLLGAGKRLFSDTDKDKQMLRFGRERVMPQRPPEAGVRRRWLIRTVVRPGPGRAGTGYGGHTRHRKRVRLSSIKDRWDPANVLYLNHNIRPSAQAGAAALGGKGRSR